MSVLKAQTPASTRNSLIILVVEIDGPGKVAVGNEIFVNAGELLPLRLVKNGAVDRLGGKEFISKLVVELLISVHRILAMVKFL